MKFLFVALFLVFGINVAGCQGADESPREPAKAADTTTSEPTAKPTGDRKMPDLETVTLGAGCFWCIEAVLDRIEGVESVQSGYMGGKTANPNYQQVCTGLTGHAEVVQVKFDPRKLPFDKLLDIFWQLHDPTQLNRQGVDEGTQYRTAIFYHTEEQKSVAEASKKKWNAAGEFSSPIVTEITAATTFYPAEDYHQEFFARNPTNAYCRVNILPKFKKLGLLKDSDR
jgi:peptide-methionine (S)-S-oxide reductase